MHKKSKVIFFSLILCSSIFADQIDKSMNIIENTNNKLKNYQNKINNVENDREELLSKYKYTSTELKNTKIYNNQLEKIINSQEKELKDINQQLIDIEKTQKNIFPLMIKMVESLKQLVKMDTPFLIEERTNRVEKLEAALSKSDIKTAEKYRIILEAFKIEYDYANSIETYQDKIKNKTVNLLRVGRTALYYQSLDLKDYGYWDKSKKTWIEIDDSSAKSNIRKAIKIAKKQQNVDFLNLPFLTLKDSK
ncbi:hypothetical protein CRV00_07450 [Malaciobacter molluscorum]|uniref:DUF3450 domain-containing protein n=1 Tax=Malaciobacter molluscorum TaxID=1032072 RepID=UPI00100A43C3|nr:DUF3450 domain-containing protein [Malaciobacter molluscorum]RXJ94398.1 hypothetical protein CRV00_07450 [Malaciobacter molluscorum]